MELLGVSWLLTFKEKVKPVEEPLSGFGQCVCVYFLALLQDFLFLQKFFPHPISSGSHWAPMQICQLLHHILALFSFSSLETSPLSYWCVLLTQWTLLMG